MDVGFNRHAESDERRHKIQQQTEMNDKDPGKFGFEIMDKTREGHTGKIDEQNPQHELRTGKRNEPENEEKQRTKIFSLSHIKSVIDLGNSAPKRQNKKQE